MPTMSPRAAHTPANNCNPAVNPTAAHQVGRAMRLPQVSPMKAQLTPRVHTIHKVSTTCVLVGVGRTGGGVIDKLARVTGISFSNRASAYPNYYQVVEVLPSKTQSLRIMGSKG
jgi:hypothetical protein